MAKVNNYICIKVMNDKSEGEKSFSALVKLFMQYETCIKKGQTYYGFDLNLTVKYISEINLLNNKLVFYISKKQGDKNFNGFIFTGDLVKIITKSEKRNCDYIPPWFKTNEHKNYLVIRNMQFVYKNSFYGESKFQSLNGVAIKKLLTAYSLVKKIVK